MLHCEMDKKFYFIICSFDDGHLKQLKKMEGIIDQPMYQSNNMGIQQIHRINQIIDLSNIETEEINNDTKKVQFYHKVYGVTFWPEYAERLSKLYLKDLVKKMVNDEFVKSVKQPNEKKKLLQTEILAQFNVQNFETFKFFYKKKLIS